METEQQKIIKKFEWMSQKHHKLSLLFYELSQSLRIEAKNTHAKEFKDYIKNTLKLDFDKIKALSNSLTDITMEDLKKDERKA